MTNPTIDRHDPRLAPILHDLINEIESISADFGPKVQEAVDLAAREPLDQVTAERLYTRILRILRNADGLASDEDIAGEVRLLVGQRGHVNPWGDVALIRHNGLLPHLVAPVPIFINRPVPMWEGYVDVTTLDLWKENHRVELQVAEFREVNHRDPDNDELLQLMHGNLHLPSLTKKDPFNIKGLAESIARKGVERPPILTSTGEPKDGNRRIAAAKYVLDSDDFTQAAKERARWIKVWVAPPGTTEDLFEAIVVALNFEDDYKEKWPEFVKARLVVGEYRKLRNERPRGISPAVERDLRRVVADQFSITLQAVTRYLRMVQWAEDFEDYHTEHGRDAAAVRYKADDIFQWFYEIQAGRSADKVTTLLEEDEDLRKIVYDLMFDVMDSGTQVRSLYKIVADPDAMQRLRDAHDQLEKKDREGALDAVKEAVTTADRNTAARKKIGFESFLRTCVDRLGQAPPDNWRSLDSTLLSELERVFLASVGVIEGELVTRGEREAPAN
jgi:hypothetical protein